MDAEGRMQLTINVADGLIGPVEGKLAAGPRAVLQSIAHNAVIAFLMQMNRSHEASGPVDGNRKPASDLIGPAMGTRAVHHRTAMPDSM